MAYVGGVKYLVDAHVSDSALYDLARHLQYTRLTPGEAVFYQGDFGDWFYIVIYGSVSLASRGTGWLDTMRAGMCFGEIGLLGQNGMPGQR